MDNSKLAALVSHPPIDPFKIAPESILLSSTHLGVQSVCFCWRQPLPGELYAPPLTQHVVTVQLRDTSKLIQGRDGRSHEAPMYQGDIIIARAGQPSFWYREGTTDLLHIAIDPGFMQRVALETCDLDPGGVELRDVFSTRDLVLNSLARLLITELRTGAIGGRLYVESLGNVLALHLLRTYCTQRLAPKCYRGGLPPHYVRRVVDYMHAYLGQPLTLSELAGLLQMSQAHFIRAFQHTMGCTPHQYLIRCRIEQAKVLLATPCVPISAVAVRVGFQTHSHFTKLFRKLVGVSPTTYRNEQLGCTTPRAVQNDTAGIAQKILP